MGNKLDKGMEEYRDISETAVAIESGRKIGELETGVRELDIDGIPYVAHSREITLTQMAKREDIQAAPKRVTGLYTFAEPESFCNFVNQHKGDGTSIRIKTKIVPGFGVEFLSVLNGNGKDAPGWGDLTAALGIAVSDDFAAFFALSENPARQIEFVQILRNRIHCVVEPSCSTICAIFAHFTANTRSTVESKIPVSGGNYQITLSESVTGESKAASTTVDVPEEIVLRLPLFKHRAETVDLRALVNWRHTDGKLFFSLAFPQIEQIVEEAVQTIRAEISAETELFVAM